MKVIVIEVTDSKASVELRPSWVGRLFGSKSCIMELRKDGTIWRVWPTDKALNRDYSFEDESILRAIERRPMQDLPIARAREITR